MPLQPSDVPALRAKHLDLMQARYHQLVNLRDRWQAFAVGILMLTGTLTLIIAALSRPSLLPALAVLFIGAIEWLFIDLMKQQDFKFFLLIRGTMEEFGHSVSEGFDKIPNFETIFGRGFPHSNYDQEYYDEGAPRFYRRTILGATIKTVVALIIVGGSAVNVIRYGP